MSTVRPFPARIVQQDAARHTVTAMSDTLEYTGGYPEPATLDPAAYAASTAALYVYRQCRDDVSYLGVVCEVGIEAFVDGRVRGHESVQPERVEALVQHHARSTAPPAPVTLLHREGEAFTRALEVTCHAPPILDFPGPDGLQQTVWRLADGPTTVAVAEELAAATHYIADGHHRVAAALEEWQRDGKPAGAGLLCVVRAMDGMRLSAFHRRVTGPVDPAGLLALLAPGFEVRPVTEPPAPPLGAFGLYVGQRWFEVRDRAGREEGLAGLDVAVLQTRILDRLDGLSPGRSSSVEATPSRASVDELTRRCDAEEGALFTLAPPSLGALTGLADAGGVMPPKTTYFEPKPCVGIFLRP